MKKSFFILIINFLSIFLFTTCNNSINKDDTSVNCEDTTSVYNRRLMMAVLYQQQAAECKALYYQGYNIARLMLDKDIDNVKPNKKRAIIVDIDETVLDNSPFEAAIITRNAKYPDDWQKWTKLAKAKACPGSVDFLNYAYNKGVTVFYITNRTFNERETTIQNLISEKFPLADTNHILFKADVSSKEKRRNLIENEFYIVELIGDNLSDFTNIFDNKSPEARSSESEKIRYEFGKKFIVLPNAMYGDWEKAMYDYSKTLSLKDKAEIRRSYLRDF